MYKIQVCESCGQPFDDNGYPICGDCNTQTFIKLKEDKDVKPIPRRSKQGQSS